MEDSAFSDTDLFNCDIPYVPNYESEEEQIPQEIPDMVSGPHVFDMDYYNPVVSYDPLCQSEEDHAHSENSGEEGMESEAQDQSDQESSEEEDMDMVDPTPGTEGHGGIPYRSYADSVSKSRFRLSLQIQHEIFEAHSRGDSYKDISERYQISKVQARYAFRKIEKVSGQNSGKHHQRKLDSSTIEDIQTHYKNGLTKKQIADLFDISHQSVTNYTTKFEQYSEKLSKKPKSISDIDIRKMVEANNSGESVNSIASRLKKSKTFVGYHISKYRRDHGMP